jgi:hypothetical protein
MAPERNGQFFAWNAQAIVFHPYQPHAACQQPHRHLCCAGVQRVVHQFAYHRGWPLDHLTRRNLADQFVGEFADGAARGLGLGLVDHEPVILGAAQFPCSQPGEGRRRQICQNRSHGTSCFSHRFHYSH